MERTNFPTKLRSALGNPFVVMLIVALMYILKAALKIRIGSQINSPMIEGDGWHNVADLFEVGAVMAVLLVSRWPTSKEYPFGRKNIEFFASLAIGAGLVFMAVRFAAASLAGLLSYFPHADQLVRSIVWLPAHKPLAMDSSTFPWVVAITAGSVILSLVVSRYQIKVGKKTGHASLVADGQETASDGRIEAVVLVGVLAEHILHWPWLEYPLGLCVAFLIGRTGLELFLRGGRVLLQRSIGLEHEEEIRKRCLNVPGVIEVTALKTFQVGHTAVCMLTVTSRLNAKAAKHIKYAIRHHLKEYLLGDDFKECEVLLQVVAPPLDFHRVAVALAANGADAALAGSHQRTTSLVICDIEDGAIVRTVHESTPADLLGFLAEKRVTKLYVFGKDGFDTVLLERNGIAVVQAPSYMPSALGLTE